MPVGGIGSGWSLGKETTAGTAVTPTRALPFMSESLKLARPRIVSDNLTGGNNIRRSSSWRAGPRSAGGDVNTNLWDSGATMLLEAMLGQIATTGSGPYVHTATWSKTQPAYTLQVGLGGVSASDRRKQVTGAKVDSWDIALAVDEDATLSLTWAAMNLVEATAATAGSIPANMKKFSWLDVALSGAGIPAGCVRALRFHGERNLRKDRKCLGTTTVLEPTPVGFGEITGTMEVEIDGSASIYNLWEADAEVSIVATLTAGTKTLVITANVRHDGDTPVVSGPEDIAVTIPFVVYAPTTDATAFSIVATNGDSTP